MCASPGTQVTMLDGTAVQLYRCNKTAAQKWTVDQADTSIRALDKCLDVIGAGTAGSAGVRLQRWGECHGKLKFAQS